MGEPPNTSDRNLSPGCVPLVRVRANANSLADEAFENMKTLEHQNVDTLVFEEVGGGVGGLFNQLRVHKVLARGERAGGIPKNLVKTSHRLIRLEKACEERL